MWRAPTACYPSYENHDRGPLSRAALTRPAGTPALGVAWPAMDLVTRPKYRNHSTGRYYRGICGRPEPFNLRFPRAYTIVRRKLV
jgi:hypothetical protein